MKYLFSFNESKKFNRRVLHGSAHSKFSEPISTGCVFILSNKFKDNKKRIYMGIIDKIRQNKGGQYEVLLTGLFYILKKHPGNIIIPEKLGYLTPKEKLDLLNMTSNGIVLNENKTPLWEISSKNNKINLFTNYQSTLKDLESLEDVMIPFTQMSKPVNLHE